jgi:hypothetical protein
VGYGAESQICSTRTLSPAPRYKLLLESLVKYTPHSHHDYKDLQVGVAPRSGRAWGGRGVVVNWPNDGNIPGDLS